MPITIHDVARLSGVSVATVSRAFGRPASVRLETREAILRAAEQVGYRPNRAARGLMTGKTGNVGVIVPDLANPFFPSVLKGVQARAREADYACFLADSGEDPCVELELIRDMANQVDGVVLCSSRMSRADLASVTRLTTVVLMNRREAAIPAVLMDSADGARQAIDHLAALGHRRIAFLAGPRSSWSNRERQRGLRAAAKATGVEITELGPFAPQFADGQRAADDVASADVTAVLAYNDLMALGVISRLSDHGISTPGDISVVGFDDIPVASMCTPSLTTVSMPTEASGRRAVELLLEQLSGADPVNPTPQRRLPTQLVIRASSGPPRSARRRTSARSEVLAP